MHYQDGFSGNAVLLITEQLSHVIAHLSVRILTNVFLQALETSL